MDGFCSRGIQEGKVTTCRKLVLGVGQEDERTLEVPSDEVSHQCGPLALVEAEVGAARA